MKRFILAFVIIGFSLLIPSVWAQDTVTPVPQPGTSYVIFDDIFVRGGPGEGYQPVGGLQAGVLLRPVSRNADGMWILIAYNRGFGWIRRDLAVWGVEIDTLPIIEEADLTPTAPPGEATATFFLPTATPAGNWVNTGGLGAYLRTGPGLRYAIYGEIDDGTRVEPVGRSDDASWILLRRTGGFAWINRALVSWTVDLDPLPVLQIDALTPSATFTGTLTPSVTSTPTTTLTATATATITPTSTFTSTSSATASATPTPTLTLTLTVTPSASPTVTSTASLTPSATETPVPTVTPSLTVTLTLASVAQGIVSTDTPPPTETFTPVPPTSTATVLPTETPRPTDTSTNTATPSLTATPSVTASATRTPTFTATLIPATNTPDTGFLLTGTAIMAEVNRRETATAMSLSTATPTQSLLSLDAMNSTGTAIFDEFNRHATETSAAAIPTETTSPTAEGTVIAAVPQDTGASPIGVVVSEPPSGIAPELLVGGGVLLVVIGYIGLYWRGASGVERYANGFVIERCPTCGSGTLHIETTVTRSLGIPRARYTVRCSECRSVMRGAGVRRWRYAVDRVENPSLYERYNNQIVEESELARLTPGVGVTQALHVRTPNQSPTYINSDDEDNR